MNLYTKLISFFPKITIYNILYYLLFCQPLFGQNFNDDDNDEKPDSLFLVNLTIPNHNGNEFKNIKIYGEIKNITNNFGEIQKYIEFLGIPYSTPPVNHLRFQRPTLDTPKYDFQANTEPSPCPQLGIDGNVIGEEDCLYLNIYAPHEISTNTKDDETTTTTTDTNRNKNKFPVLVWFHGESIEKSTHGIFDLFSSGSIYDLNPEIFISNKILIVIPQYRLGSLGFLNSANEDLNGNIGLYDQLIILEWIQKYIYNFGGDTNQVIVMGHGSSAISIGLLAISNLTKGLFHRIIMMSGSPLSPLAIDIYPKSTFIEIALQNNCPTFPTLRFVRCMQKKSFEDIIKADDLVNKGKHIGKSKIPHPVIQKDPDDRFLPPILNQLPLNSFTSGNFIHVPLMIGVSSAEMSGFLPNLSGKELHEIHSTIFTNENILNQFIRGVLMKSTTSPELLGDLVFFEYFAGLNISDPARHEQAVDILEEVLSDFLFHIPALSLAKLWSRYAPVHFYVFDYVSSSSEQINVLQNNFNKKRFNGRSSKQEKESSFGSGLLQASHGSDIRFLMDGHYGSAKDREISNVFVDFWISFIHKGSPLHSGFNWPQFREDTLKYLRINDQIQISQGFHIRRDNLWNQLHNKINNHGCNNPVLASTSTSTTNSRRRPNHNIFEFKSNEKISRLPFNYDYFDNIENTDLD